MRSDVVPRAVFCPIVVPRPAVPKGIEFEHHLSNGLQPTRRCSSLWLLSHVQPPAYIKAYPTSPPQSRSGEYIVYPSVERYVTGSVGYKLGADVHVHRVALRRPVEVMLGPHHEPLGSHALLVLSLLLSAIPVSLSIGSATLLADPLTSRTV